MSCWRSWRPKGRGSSRPSCNISWTRRPSPLSTVYKPFGEEAAGTRTLTQFQVLQERSKETASLRDLGLSDSEILLWKNRASAEKSSGLGAAPEATQDRIEAIQEKIAEHQRILSSPQHFAGSKQLSRREMEIESALFQGTDRHSFLRVLYHQGRARQEESLAHLETVYQELLGHELPKWLPSASQSDAASSYCVPSGSLAAPPNAAKQEASGPVMVTQPVEFIPEEEIQKNCLSEEDICKIPRFSSYSPGEPSKVLYLKNLSRRVTVTDLLSLFARFQEEGGPQIQFRLLSGRMRGQAFLTFPSVSKAQAALRLANGFKLLGKPLVIEYGRKTREADGPDSEAAPSPELLSAVL